jgi:hypothetical protein
LKTNNELLSILNIKSNYYSNAQEALNWIQNLNQTYGVNAKLLTSEDEGGLAHLKKYVPANDIDLLCTVKYNDSVFDRLLGGVFPVS